MKKFIFILICFCLSGCLDFFLYRDSYTIDNMAYWEHIDTKEKASLKTENDCFDKVNQNNSFTRDKYGQCLYEQGYRFRTDSILYCYYYMKERCKAYDKYRK
ncbi:hypothetical protein EDC45_0754 [Mesocricetibacter intestinalis]|uniref:Uncharacterized protein n=1 Tax=Mesocricetibacter intestinalis TaxID=1521930 RepID=A0A4V3D9W3_9PAST|nr:hypothetical protein EDC45_0754 [Mesocricetibacter intestinalis]